MKSELLGPIIQKLWKVFSRIFLSFSLSLWNSVNIMPFHVSLYTRGVKSSHCEQTEQKTPFYRGNDLRTETFKTILSHHPHIERDLSHPRSPRGWSHNQIDYGYCPHTLPISSFLMILNLVIVSYDPTLWNSMAVFWAEFFIKDFLDSNIFSRSRINITYFKKGH